jgi:hypothetical protein
VGGWLFFGRMVKMPACWRPDGDTAHIRDSMPEEAAEAGSPYPTCWAAFQMNPGMVIAFYTWAKDILNVYRKGGTVP